MSFQQLREWMTFAELEPFGPERADFRAGVVAASVYNAAGKKFGKLVTAKELVPTFGDADEAEATPAPKRARNNWQFMKALGQAYTMASKEQALAKETRGTKHR